MTRASAGFIATVVFALSFLEHLDEVRRRLIWSVVFIATAFVGCWMFSGQLYDLASAPIRSHPAVTLSSSRPQDIFSLHVKVTMVAAIFISAPLVLSQAWLCPVRGRYRSGLDVRSRSRHPVGASPVVKTGVDQQ